MKEAFESRSRRFTFDDVTIHDPAMPCPRRSARFNNLRADIGKGSRQDDLMRHTEISAPPDLQVLCIEGLKCGCAVEHHHHGFDAGRPTLVTELSTGRDQKWFADLV